jgi:hypothetical protein
LFERLARESPAASTPDSAINAVLDEFWPMFVNSRSLCSYITESLVGAKSLVPGAFYQETTPYLCVVLKEPLTPQVLAQHNRIGGWTNENCLIRLWAVLESHGFTKPIRPAAAKSTTVKLLGRLRQHFAHGSGAYDETKRRHRKLRRDLLEAYPVPGNPGGIPTDINQVLKPIFDDCRVYVRDVLEGSLAP